MKKRMVPLTLLGATVLASCSGGPAPVVHAATAAITGRVASGSGTGTITLNTTANSALSTAPVDSGGNFTLPLPTADQLSAQMVSAGQVLGKIGCTGTLTADAADARGYAQAGLQITRGSLQATVLSGTLTVNKLFGVRVGGSYDGQVWVYTNTDTHVSGQVDCSQLIDAGVPVHITVDAAMTAGWNELELKGHAGIGNSGISIDGTLKATNSGVTTWRTIADLKSALN